MGHGQGLGVKGSGGVSVNNFFQLGSIIYATDPSTSYLLTAKSPQHLVRNAPRGELQNKDHVGHKLLQSIKQDWLAPW